MILNYEVLQTDENGTYLFTNLENGDYYIQVDKSTLPEGYGIYKTK